MLIFYTSKHILFDTTKDENKLFENSKNYVVYLPVYRSKMIISLLLRNRSDCDKLKYRNFCF